MKSPCANCPFLKKSKYALNKAKIEEILYGITHDRAFYCHQTVDYSQDFRGVVTEQSKVCFGATLFLENTVSGGCRSNVMFRIAIIQKEFGLGDLRQDSSVYEGFDAFREGV
jgi:hypothetical protein